MIMRTLGGDMNCDGVVTSSDISGYSAALNAGWTGPSVAYDWDAENRLVRVRQVAGTETAGACATGTFLREYIQ